ncbi:MAG: pyridoxine 5'-phosphate synthase [Elusimicrobia bacterium]|nr:pyridoxine 5'-phosphate synthase [Elusimicrobiota bacterium]
MIKLGVNIDHIATVRQARKEDFPSVLHAAEVCQSAGATGITVHLREDRRHIQDKDVYELKSLLNIPLNLEMAATDEMVNIAREVKPAFVCLVPEKREELTTEGGLNILSQKERLTDVVNRLKDAGIKVSMFIDADIAQVKAASDIGADIIEIHTGNYAKYFKLSASSKEFTDELSKIAKAASAGHALGLTINAGHGLDYDNIAPICALKEMNEFNIGFSIVARAVFTGLDAAVREMLAKLKQYSC